MVPQLAIYAGYEQLHHVSLHRQMKHEEVWQLPYNDAMASVAFLYFEQQMQKHLQRLQQPATNH